MSTVLSPVTSSSKLPLRSIVLGIALVATIIASVVDFSAPFSAPFLAPDAPEPTRQKTVNSTIRRDLPAVAETTVVREQYATQAGDLFAPHSWQPPPPPPPKPAAPKAPPLPFLYLGKVLEGGEILVFLGQGPRTHLLRRGDVLAEYKIDEITPAQITFVYLPLNEKQHLTFGSAN